MSLSTYSGLKTSVANYLNRDDLTDTIPDFITLVENKLNRDLKVRVNLVRSSTSTTSGQEFYNLPSDIIELRNVTYTSDASTNYALAYLSPESLSREYGANGNGFPRAYTTIGMYIKFAPIPDGTYEIDVNYYQKLTPLSDSNQTNTILTNYPNLYLYGACREGAIYLNDTEMLQRFAALYTEALAEITASEESAKYSGTVMTMAITGDPGSLVRRGV
jgi:hypothetical protein